MSLLNRPHLVSLCIVSSLVLGLAAVATPGLVRAEDNKSTEPEAEKRAPIAENVTQGALRVAQEDGSLVECPLKHTEAETDISGFIARVKVTQTFQNPTSEKIEAVYVFPLPHEAAVDSMTMRIGARKIVGLIKRRDVARQVYEQALAQGQTAALLEQERPNIFTQSVGNIEPGQQVKIEISYVDVLKYDMGTYEFHFPMVVGPRFIPGSPTDSPEPPPAELAGKVSPPVSNTDRVADATRISPPVLKPGYRNGHDIGLTVRLDAGVPIQALEVASHEAEVQQDGNRQATIQLSSADSIPNKDFVVRYDVMGKRPELAVLGHTGKYTDTGGLGQGYFLLMMQPKEDDKLKQMPPREVVFLVDTSGSMRGQPTAKVREAMQAMLELCRPKDTVQVITFASQAYQLFEAPVPVTEANIIKATNFARNLRGAGGTHMLKGIKLAIDAPIDQTRLRIVVMLTDGYIGNEAEIIKHVGANCGDQIRFWALGIGSSPNMFLVDGVAKQGGGMGKRLGLQDDTAALTQEVMNRIQRAQLSKIRIDWGGLEVAETYPVKIPELWAGRPVILFGRYTHGGKADVQVSGLVEGEEVSWPLAVELPETQAQHDVLAKVWARKKIEDLMHQAFYQDAPAIEEEVTSIALDYKLMSQYTSFVAIDEAQQGELSEPARRPRRMSVPIPLPDGTRYEGFFGDPEPGEDLQLATAVYGAAPLVIANRLTAGAVKARPASPTLGASVPYRLGVGRVARRSVARAQSTPSLRNVPARGKLFRQYAQKAGSAGVLKPLRGESLRRAGVARGGYGFAGGASAFGRGRQAAQQSADFYARTQLKVLSEVFADDGVASPTANQGLSYARQALQAKAEIVATKAAAALQQARELEEKNDSAAAREKYLRAYFLDRAAANVGASSGEILSPALAAIERLRSQEVEAWTKRYPALAERLDLVLRDKSIAEALKEVSEAAGVNITQTPGSVDDVTALLGEEPRVSFLDLRRATLAEALDWTLLPANLTWKLVDGKIVAASQRRLAGETPWVYDVSIAALPAKEELGDFKDHETSLRLAQSLADQLIGAVRGDLSVDDESIVWFAPGQLLVFGDTQRQVDAARLLAILDDANQKPTGKHGTVYLAGQKRAEARAEAITKRKLLARSLNVARIHDMFGWRLLAAAAGRQMDIEFLTELQIAWNREETDDLLAGPGAAAILKSNWIVNEAARALPNEAELQALARLARDKSRPAAETALAALAKDPEEAEEFAKTLYAALALQDEEAFLAKALPLLTKAGGGESKVAQARFLAAALLGDPAKLDRTALAKIISDGPANNEMVVLTALAARRCGGDMWELFRATSRELLAEQPLAGSVVVLVNRLASGQLPVVAAE